MSIAKPNEFRRRVSRGKQPMVNLFGAAYSSAYLQRHPELQGCVLLLTLDPSDMERLDCRTVDGNRLPTLRLAKLAKIDEQSSIPRFLREARLRRFGVSAKAAEHQPKR